jgi:Sigma-70 region 2
LEVQCVLEVEYRISVPDRLGDKVNDGTTSEQGPDSARVFDEHRDLLISVAYRVLGSVTDAEDAVQEAWLRWSGVDHSGVADPRAFLVRIPPVSPSTACAARRLAASPISAPGCPSL